jgi:hypothetical protein
MSCVARRHIYNVQRILYSTTGCQLTSADQPLPTAKTKKGSDPKANDNDACHDLRLAFPSISGTSAEHKVTMATIRIRPKPVSKFFLRVLLFSFTAKMR